MGSSHSGTSGNRCQCGLHRARDKAGPKPVGQGIDRLEIRERGDRAVVENAVRVRHLPQPSNSSSLPETPPDGALRQHALDLRPGGR